MIYCKIKVDSTKAEEIRDFYNAEEIQDENRPYEYFHIKKNGIDIKCYRNRKEIYTVVFSGGEEAINEAYQFSLDVSIEEVIPKHKEENEGFDDISRQIGSDEVGVGDFFGPLIVVASYFEANDLPYLEKMKITDSKKMTDDYILDIGEDVLRNSRCYSVLVSPNKLSSLAEQGINIHRAMALMHNFAQKKLMEKYSLTNDIIVYIDQFEEESLYRRHVKEEIISNNLFFRTRAETFYPSVALSSVIARYLFLKEWEKMEEILGMEIPKGASAIVDKTYSQLLKERGSEAVSPFVKKFFRNYK